MALPTTVGGVGRLGNTGQTVGPFKSSGGNFYVIGRSNSDSTKLKALKATDPSTSFSSVGTDPQPNGVSQVIQGLCAYQVGDVLHIACTSWSSNTSVGNHYIQFDMSSDTWGSSEAIQTAINPTTSAAASVDGISLVVRSDGHVVVVYQGPRVASMGNSYARIVAKRRTGAATWVAADGVTNPTPLDAGGTTDYITPEAVLGASDRTHFFFAPQTTRSLSSANALDTAQTGTTQVPGVTQAVGYDSSGTTKIVAVADGSLNWESFYFDSAANAAGTTGPRTSLLSTCGKRGFNDGTDVYVIYALNADNDLYVKKSTDHGATFGSATNIFTATVGTTEASLSKDGDIYQRGSDIVIPYVVNDGGTLKYNEYVVRTVSGGTTFQQPITFSTGQSLAFARTPGKTLKSTIANAFSLIRQINKRVPLSQSQGVQAIKAVGKQPFSAGLGQSVSTARVKASPKVLSLSQAQSVTLLRATGKLIALGQAQAITLARQVGHIVSAPVAQAVVVVRQIGHAILAAIGELVSVTPQFVAGGGQEFEQVVSFTQAPALTLRRETGKLLGAAGIGQSVTLRRQSGKVMAAPAGQQVTLRRSIGKGVAASIAQSLAVIRSTGRRILFGQGQQVAVTTPRVRASSLAVTQGQSVSLRRSTGKLVAFALAQSITLMRAMRKIITLAQAQVVNLSTGTQQTFQKALTLTQAQSVTLRRQVGRIVAALTGQSIRVVTRIGKIISVQIAQAVALLRTTGKRVLVTQAQSVTTTRLRLRVKIISLSQGQSITLRRAAGKLVAALTGQSIRVVTRIGKIISAQAAQAVALLRTTGKRVLVTHGQVVTTTRRRERLWQVSITQGHAVILHRSMRSVGLAINVAQANAASLARGLSRLIVTTHGQLVSLLHALVPGKVFQTPGSRSVGALRQFDEADPFRVARVEGERRDQGAHESRIAWVERDPRATRSND